MPARIVSIASTALRKAGSAAFVSKEFVLQRFKKIVLLILVCLFLFPLNIASTNLSSKAGRGVVSHRISGCDYFIVATKSSYDVLEWFGGHDPDKGDYLVGGFESYGFHDIYDETADEDLRGWTEDYDLTKEDALEKLTDQCG